MAEGAPRAVRNEAAAGFLALEWGEMVLRLPHALLRAACPCAFCRARRWRGETVAVAAAVRVTALQPFGYGLQLVFSDGHDRGIFPWTFLRELGESNGLSAGCAPA